MKQTIIDAGGLIFMIVFFWIIFCVAMHIILGSLGLFDKARIMFKVPKSKKYLSKLDPIYELYNNNYGYSHYYIRKWSLSYKMNETFPALNVILFPWPLGPEIYKYHIENSYFICEKKDVSNIEGDLESNYNIKHNESLVKEAEKKRLKDEKNSKIKELNRSFKENYE